MYIVDGYQTIVQHYACLYRGSHECKEWEHYPELYTYVGSLSSHMQA